MFMRTEYEHDGSVCVFGSGTCLARAEQHLLSIMSRIATRQIARLRARTFGGMVNTERETMLSELWTCLTRVDIYRLRIAQAVPARVQKTKKYLLTLLQQPMRLTWVKRYVPDDPNRYSGTSASFALSVHFRYAHVDCSKRPTFAAPPRVWYNTMVNASSTGSLGTVGLPATLHSVRDSQNRLRVP